MTSPTKLTLSSEERLLVNNSNWILTKRTIIEKAVLLLGELQGKIKPVILDYEKLLPQAIIHSEPKISKGESYRMLPYVLLDYPKYFDKENIFVVRTMFWWGNFFSITLHLSGQYKTAFAIALAKNVAALQLGNYYICVNDDQWQHHFEPDNYFTAAEKTSEELKSIILQRPFLKIARKFPLEQWDEMPIVLERSFIAMMELLTPSVSPEKNGKD